MRRTIVRAGAKITQGCAIRDVQYGADLHGYRTLHIPPHPPRENYNFSQQPPPLELFILQ